MDDLRYLSLLIHVEGYGRCVASGIDDCSIGKVGLTAILVELDEYGVKEFIHSQDWFFLLGNKVSEPIDSCGGDQSRGMFRFWRKG